MPPPAVAVGRVEGQGRVDERHGAAEVADTAAIDDVSAIAALDDKDGQLTMATACCYG
jgi:hypothetical protein